MGHSRQHFARAGAVLAVMILISLFCLVFSAMNTHSTDVNHIMTKDEREQLKEEARDMFYHAYRAYMENAYPADELMPLSCTGRYRGLGPSRGDIDDCLGNFSLTLVDTLDTLVVLGDLEEFEHAVGLVIRDVSFDTDIVVSVFETNIRMLGGLLSAHILSEYLQQRAGIMTWYRGELLSMAKDLGYRLMPAFNTSTGIPHARVNLRHGLKSPLLENARETCTACAGTMVLELAALSRLSGEPIFEEKAHRAMDVLWQMRHRSSDLMGTVLNVHSGDWVRRDSGVGAGIDSYYEYCLKAYVLLGDEKYLGRFNKHYSAVMKYISQGPMLLDVLMHRPHTNSRNFMDALLAFWPGLQVLKGDIRPAVETHEMLYQVMQRHNFIPEAFTTDFQVHWGQHPLRPEFLESTYFLYRATQDPYYLQVGKHALRSLQTYARVPCGYAAVKDVRTSAHEDRMDSFVLAETFKYLFLLFADPSELVLDLDEFLFTTEAHLLPLSLARRSNLTAHVVTMPESQREADDLQFSRTCPNTLHLFPESVRRPLRNMVNGICPRRSSRRKLHAVQFQVGNPDHMKTVRDMGIAIITLPDGRLQLLHTFANARSPGDAEEGLQFMQEMVELSRSQAQTPDSAPLSVSFSLIPPGATTEQKVSLSAGPAHFGREIRGDEKVTARVAVTDPLKVCTPLTSPEKLKGRIAVMERGDCMFIEKARRVERAGAVAAIVLDNSVGSSASNSPMFAMSGDGTNDVNIPLVFLFQQDAFQLLQALALDPGLMVTLGDAPPEEKKQAATEVDPETEALISEAAGTMDSRLLENILDKLKGSVRDFLSKHHLHPKSPAVEEEEAEKIRTSSHKKGRGRGRGGAGVGGAQDGDGLGSSVREHLGAGVPTVEGEGRTLGPRVEGEGDEELGRLQYEAKLRQLMTMLALQAPDNLYKEDEEGEDPSSTKQTPKFSDLIDNFLNNDPSGMDKLVDKMRDKVRVSKINDIIEELEINPSGELKRGIAEMLERKKTAGVSDDFVVTDSVNDWKASSRETVEGLLRPVLGHEPTKGPTRSRKAKAPDEL